MDADTLKMRAAECALDYVRPGMKLGLGTGSTAEKFVDLIGAKVKSGLDVICVPTSKATRLQAEALGIPLATLGEQPELDLTVDVFKFEKGVDVTEPPRGARLASAAC